MAHVEYFDLNQGKQILDLTAAGKVIAGSDIPLGNPADWTTANQSTVASGATWTNLGGSYASGSWGYSVHVTNLDGGGWTDGTRSNVNGGLNLLGDSHVVDFANFHLNQQSNISIVFSDDMAGSGFGLNPSFTLYRGSLVYQGHDTATLDQANPISGGTKIQNAQDAGSVVDSQGIVSPFRDTVHPSNPNALYYGQFNAQGGWSQANSAGNWSAIQYITSVTTTPNPSGDWTGNPNSNSLLNYNLPPGDYTIAFSGNAQPASYTSARSATSSSPYGIVSNQGGTLSLTVVPASSPTPTPTTTPSPTPTPTPTPTPVIPVANADIYLYNSGAGNVRTVAAAGVLSNDTGTPAPTAVLVTTVTAAQGTLSLNANGGFTYTPASTFTGTASFTYRASNSAGQSVSAATVSLQRNGAPTQATNSCSYTRASQSVTSSPANSACTVLAPNQIGLNILANDSDPNSAVSASDGLGKTIVPSSVVLSNITGGTAVSNGNGTVSFTFTSNTTKSGSFRYTVADNLGLRQTSATTVSLTAK
jgi:hypothetical protein